VSRVPENCAHTYAKGTEPPAITPASPSTFHLLNSGLVVLRPSADLFANMALRLRTDPIVQTFTFPDQDFLALYFHGRFLPLGYAYNALKTMSHCHAPLWDDAAVKNVHYIIDKPWAGRPAQGDPYFKLHGWWWEAYDRLARDFQGGAEAWTVVAATVEKRK
jgi:hypothetical protein